MGSITTTKQIIKRVGPWTFMPTSIVHGSLFTTLVASVLESMCLGIEFAHAELEWIRDFD